MAIAGERYANAPGLWSLSLVFKHLAKGNRRVDVEGLFLSFDPPRANSISHVDSPLAKTVPINFWRYIERLVNQQDGKR